ncbi:MAG: L,D-transpeptidase [Hyphomicrobiales bacterium]|nr:L,D-transpeptidase [Hyphomicrobiales bacterium]
MTRNILAPALASVCVLGAIYGFSVPTYALDADMLQVMRMHPGPGANAGPASYTTIPREIVSYNGPYAPGTVVVQSSERRLYLVMPDHKAMKYGVGVGRPGFAWSGTVHISAKKKWPGWTPPASMLRRRPHLPHYVKGGPNNPLGARAMYLSGTEYRIHGSNEPETIGHAMSSGCIRMTNADIKDFYNRVKVGATVHVLR